MESRARAAAEAHAPRVVDVLVSFVGPSRAAALSDTGSTIARALTETDTATQPLDVTTPWRAGTVPVAELSAAGCPEWVAECPHGGEVVLVAELDAEGGSRALRDLGPISADALAELLSTTSAGVVDFRVVPWPGRAPTVVLALAGGVAASRSGDELLAEVTSVVASELAQLRELEGRLDDVLASGSEPFDAVAAASIARVMRDRACGEGWRRVGNRLPSRAALTMRAIRTARRRPVALRRVPGQVARGLLRRGRKDRLVATVPVPDALLRLRAGIPFDGRAFWAPRAPDGPPDPAAPPMPIPADPAALGVTVTVVRQLESSDERSAREEESEALGPNVRVVVVPADVAGPVLGETLRSIESDFVAFWPSGVGADPDILGRLCHAMAQASSRVVAAPVGLLHVTELGLDLRLGESLASGYFAPLDDGIVVLAAADARGFEPAGSDRLHVRIHDAARFAGLATFVSPDVWVARDLGELTDDNDAAYLDVFGRLDEAVGEEEEAVDATVVGLAADIVARRARVRDRCDRLAVGTDAERSGLQRELSSDRATALVPRWVGEPDLTPVDPDALRPPSRIESALAELFRESPRLRDE